MDQLMRTLLTLFTTLGTSLAIACLVVTPPAAQAEVPVVHPAAAPHPTAAKASDPKDKFVSRYVEDHDIVTGGGIEQPLGGAIKVKYRMYYRVYLTDGRTEITAFLAHQGKQHGLDGGWPSLVQHVDWHITITDDFVPSGLHHKQSWDIRHKPHYHTWVHDLGADARARNISDDPRVCVRVKIATVGPDDGWKHIGCQHLNKPKD